MRLKSALVPIALAGALHACAPAADRSAGSVPAPQSAVPAAAGAQSCVELSQIREARVIDDRTIDFYLNDRRVLRNTLPHTCPSLGFEKAFTYATSLSRLCSVDIITVINQGGGVRTGASCGLGSFVPYTPPPPAR